MGLRAPLCLFNQTFTGYSLDFRLSAPVPLFSERSHPFSGAFPTPLRETFGCLPGLSPAGPLAAARSIIRVSSPQVNPFDKVSVGCLCPLLDLAGRSLPPPPSSPEVERWVTVGCSLPSRLAGISRGDLVGFSRHSAEGLSLPSLSGKTYCRTFTTPRQELPPVFFRNFRCCNDRSWTILSVKALICSEVFHNFPDLPKNMASAHGQCARPIPFLSCLRLRKSRWDFHPRQLPSTWGVKAL
jgi:hypothetical protein